jgi:CDP-diacylglycerol--glycerol-3-phosphate 3-phosphatidyltransferase
MHHKRAYYFVNAITLYRLVAAPLMVFLLIYSRPDIFKWMIGISFFTDAIDGYFARKFNVASIAGAKLDSIADDLTIVVAMAAVFVFKTEFVKEQSIIFICLFALLIIQTIYALFRYGKISSFHTYSAKIAAILQGSFFILLFFLPEPLYPLFYIAAFVTGVELLEELFITHFLPEWETDVKGLYWVLKRKGKART